MTARNLLKAGLTIAVVAVAGTFAVRFVRSYGDLALAVLPRDSQFSNAFWAAKKQGLGVVDLRNLAGGDWDTLRIYSEYYPREQICADLHFSAPRCRLSLIPSMDEGAYHFVVLTKGDRFVYREIVDNVLFGEGITNGAAISRTRAVFKLERLGEQNGPNNIVYVLGAEGQSPN